MKKTAQTFFIIPGFKERATDTQYRWLISHIKKNGWKAIQVPVVWNNSVISQNAEDFKKFYLKHKSERNQILGFSYGAVITFLAAETLHPDHIYLCSLSPDFKEDIKSMSPWIKRYIGKNRCNDTFTRSAKRIARNLTVPTTIFYGEVEGQEFPSLKGRCEETAVLATSAELVVVPNAPHKIDFPTYQAAIKNELYLSEVKNIN
jgi:hypothetical protein